MATIDVSAGELRLRYQTDDAGRLRQIGFRPVPAGGSPIESGAFPAEAFPLAYPSWGDETGAAPSPFSKRPRQLRLCMRPTRG